MVAPLPPDAPKSYETNARFDGTAWVADVDGVEVRAASPSALQQQVRDEVIRQTGNDRIMVQINFL